MEASKKRHLGGLPPRYGFMLNPYPDQRVWRCPQGDCIKTLSEINYL